MSVAHDPAQLDVRPRAVAIGSFDGVHRGHRAVIDAVRATGLEPTVITFDPHPRIALGNKVELLTTLERRLELLVDAGVNDVLVAAFTPELQRLTPERAARFRGYLAAVATGAPATPEELFRALDLDGDALDRGLRAWVIERAAGLAPER